MPIGRERILIETLLGRSPAASSVAAVIKEKDCEADVMKLSQIFKPMDDIARIPVAPEHHRGRREGGDEPAEQLRSVGSLK